MNKFKFLLMGLLIGSLMMFFTAGFADTIREYTLARVEYPVYVNNYLYDPDLPVLNYQGHTYIPLRATAQLLGADVAWDSIQRRVDITLDPTAMENPAFRSIYVTGSQGNYNIIGQARVFEATIQYEVEDGHILFAEGFTTASQGGPDWGNFEINIQIDQAHLPAYGQLTLILFEESAKDGSRLHELAIPLEIFND